jgi:hypothetical protein
MQTNNLKLETFAVKVAGGFTSIVIFLLLVGLVLLVSGLSGTGFAQDAQPRTFSSPADAADALFQAIQKEDEPDLESILGAGKEVSSSSDAVEDKVEREQFSKKYQEMHRLVREPEGSMVLYIGAENWPFPIPLMSKNGAWYFDSDTGTREILFRRIGENEAVALQVCEEFAITKKDHNLKPASYDPITQFAQNLAYAGAVIDSVPFQGYYFRVVNETSAASTNSSVSGGHNKSGATLVAYPAEYRSSGVNTFIVTQNDIVFEKDLGPETRSAAASIKSRASDWRAAE